MMGINVLNLTHCGDKPHEDISTMPCSRVCHSKLWSYCYEIIL